MRTHRRVRNAGLVLLALAGLAVAVALSVAASNLSKQPIGLSGEPLRAGQTLAPAVEKPLVTKPVVKQARKHRTPAPAQPAATVTQTTVAPVTRSHDQREAREREPEPDDD